ncbi:hypothetical protein QUB00_30260 [Microcoleus sp. F8_C2]
MNLRLKLSILSRLQLFVIQTISRKIRAWWFFDRRKLKTPRQEKVLFVGARHIYRCSRSGKRGSGRETQVESISNIVRLYRGFKAELTVGGSFMLTLDIPRQGLSGCGPVV